MKEVQKMKKGNFITGILYVLFGAACLIVALLLETKLESIYGDLLVQVSSPES